MYLTRSQVPYDPTLPRLGYAVPASARSEIVLHHSVVVDSDFTPNVWETLLEVKMKAVRMQTIRPDLGLDVPYTDLAFCMSDGSVTLVEGRGHYRTGAHTAGHNTAAFGVGWMGDFRHNLPAGWPDQVRQVAQYYRTLKSEFPNLNNVYGHLDFKQTGCPALIYDQVPYFQQVFTGEDDIMQIGDTGQDVRKLQQFYNRWIGAYSLTYPTLTDDGVYGALTEAAVSTFQGWADLEDDGICDPITISTMIVVVKLKEQ